MTSLKGRGSQLNPTNRFERTSFEAGDYAHESYDDVTSPRTQLFPDPSRTIVTENDSPDVGFEFSVNPYRGCEHGCIYCFARPTHEYLGWSAGLDFETKILVKYEAAQLLEEKLSSKTWRPELINFSGVTDCYQPVERKLEITRRCLEMMLKYRNPYSIITKNHLVTRDLDLIRPMAELNAAAVFISVTTLDPDLAEKLEPRTSRPGARLRAIEELSRAGVPVGVMVAPLIPGLTDHEAPKILAAVASAGAKFASYVPLRLPFVLDDLFIQWLTDHYPDRRDKVIARVKEIRGGKINEADFGSRMRGVGVYADQLREMFHLSCKRVGLNQTRLSLTTEHFRRNPAQLSLF